MMPKSFAQDAAELPVSALRRRLHNVYETIPARWRRFFRQPDPYFQLDFAERGLRLFSVTHGDAALLDESVSTSEHSLERGALVPRMREALSSDPLVLLTLSSAACLRRIVEMPKASSSALRAALGYEIERLSPLGPERVYFDFSVLRRGTNGLKVEARIVERTVIDNALSYCSAQGIKVGAIGLSGDARELDSRYFPLERWAVMALFWRRQKSGLLALASLVLAVAVIVAAYYRGEARQARLDMQLSAARTETAAVTRLRAQTADLRSEIGMLAAEKGAAPVTTNLANLARAIPDGTWLTEVDVNGPKIRIQGFSAAASSLIGILDRSNVFENAQFEAPVSREAPGQPERFDISFRVKS